jgi:hypothetical protein
MHNQHKTAIALVAILTMLFGMQTSHAALVSFSITGEVLAGDDGFFPNDFGLDTGDFITATGFFDDSVLSSGTGTVSFGSGSGNSMTINVGTVTFTASDDSGFGSGFPKLVFSSNLLQDFDFTASTPTTFNSNGLFFDDIGGNYGDMFGEWSDTVSLTPVPVPAALWLFGSGLIGLAGVARRKKSRV